MRITLQELPPFRGQKLKRVSSQVDGKCGATLMELRILWIMPQELPHFNGRKLKRVSCRLDGRYCAILLELRISWIITPVLRRLTIPGVRRHGKARRAGPYYFISSYSKLAADLKKFQLISMCLFPRYVHAL